MAVDTIQKDNYFISSKNSEIVELVRQWGGASCNAILDPRTSFFFKSNLKGTIGYRHVEDCAIVFGDPVCPFEVIPELTKAFHHYCQENGMNVVYISVSEDFAMWAVKNVCASFVEYGEEFFLDPHDDPRNAHGTHASLVRRKVKHAVREGVQVEEYTAQDRHIEQAMDQVATDWLRGRKGPQIHISDIYLFDNRLGKRWFYAKQNDTIIGVCMLSELKSRKGWLLNHLMNVPGAPGGTPEILVITALETLSKENYHYVTFGSMPAKQLGEIIGLNIFSRVLSKIIYQIARKVFQLDGFRIFWEKFFPKSEPSYILFSNPQIGLKELKALFRALNAKYKGNENERR